MIILKLIVGLVLLVIGAEALVRGASRIASTFGISPLVIGLTVVAMGTSSPELAVSVMASLSGQSDIALGNVVGSNIFNVLFILGISALIIPLVVHQQIIKMDVPILIGLSLLTWWMASDGNIQLWEGIVLILLGIAYTILLIRMSKKEKKAVQQEYDEAFGEQASKAPKSKTWMSALFVLVGLAMLILGSSWLVDGAVYIAQSLGVSDLVIGLTIIAAGTSLPEVATSIIAALRGERDIAVGNVVGSNLFNIFFILGIAAVSGGGIAVADSAIRFDLPVMTVVAFACLPIFFTGSRLDRWEGAVFLMYYIAYTAYLILASQNSSSLEVYSRAILWFAVPITILTLGIVAWRQAKRNKAV
ncbi:MAG: calcium/sodium antiporter [Saprospiraceae bacterium]|nr:calcium/sodium antiporter [Saprospiraceae bacterium]